MGAIISARLSTMPPHPPVREINGTPVRVPDPDHELWTGPIRALVSVAANCSHTPIPGGCGPINPGGCASHCNGGGGGGGGGGGAH